MTAFRHCPAAHHPTPESHRFTCHPYEKVYISSCLYQVPLHQVWKAWIESCAHNFFLASAICLLLWNSVLSPPAHFTWNFITQQQVHSGFIKAFDAIPPWSLLTPNTGHRAHLCLARVRRWPSCHWQLCSSTSSLEIGVDTLGSQSSPLLLRWAWSPHSSDRIVAAWGPVLGCSHRGWAESPERNTGDQLPRTWKKKTQGKQMLSVWHSVLYLVSRNGERKSTFSIPLCILLTRKHPFHCHFSPKYHHYVSPEIS